MSTKILLEPERRSRDEEYIYSLLTRFIVGNELALRCISKELSLLRVLRGIRGVIRVLDKPALIAIFLGCTGTGKSYLVQVICKLLFNDFNGAIKIVGSELSQEHQLSKLLGAPHGYIGFDRKPLFTKQMLDEPGYLASIKGDPMIKFYSRLMKKIDYAFQRQTVLRDGIRNVNITAITNNSNARLDYQEAHVELEAVTENLNQWIDKRDQLEKIIPDISSQVLQLPPYNPQVGYASVCYVDEIEKAHKALFRLLLEVTDRGRLTTTGAYGETISFINTLFFMTSNIGQSEMLKITGDKEPGFRLSTPSTKEGLEKYYEETRQKIFKATYKEFIKVADPEFVGRVGTKNIYTFIQQSREEQQRLLKDIMLPQYNVELKQVFPVEVSMTKQVCNFILDQARTEENIVLGTRPVIDIFKSEIKSSITALMGRSEEEGGILYGDKISIELDSKQKNLQFFLRRRNKKNYDKIKIGLKEIQRREELINESGGLCEFVFDYQEAA